MKVIKINLKTNNSIKIKPMADLHLGDRNVNLTKIKEDIQQVKDEPNTYTILNGDLINNAIKTSISDVYGEVVPPMEQLKRVIDLLKPIKDKIICVTSGNHEARSYKTDGVDLLEIASRELGIEDKYSSESAYIFLRFGKDNHRKSQPMYYSIYVNHGCGAGRKEGGKVNRLCDMASIVDADIYIHSHTHLPLIVRESYFRSYPNKSQLTQIERLFVNTGSYLKYGGYGELCEYKPNSNETPTIYLENGHKRFGAKL